MTARNTIWRQLPKADFTVRNVRLYHGDVTDILQRLPEGLFDAVVTDPPYGCTANDWDQAPVSVKTWSTLLDPIRTRASVMAVCAQHPFTMDLITTLKAEWRYELIWHKSSPTGWLSARLRPLRAHEHVQVFAKRGVPNTYNPQFTEGKPYTYTQSNGSSNYRATVNHDAVTVNVNHGQRHPTTVLRFTSVRSKGQHPTAKPVTMMDWLVRTYSNVGEVVGDCFMGSGTTGVAAVRAGRKFVGIERDPHWFEVATQRISDALRQR